MFPNGDTSKPRNTHNTIKRRKRLIRMKMKGKGSDISFPKLPIIWQSKSRLIILFLNLFSWGNLFFVLRFYYSLSFRWVVQYKKKRNEAVAEWKMKLKAVRSFIFSPSHLRNCQPSINFVDVQIPKSPVNETCVAFLPPIFMTLPAPPASSLYPKSRATQVIPKLQ